MICEIWKGIFQLQQISIHSDFFQLGGHSLRAAKLMAELFKTFKVEVSLQDIYKLSTIQQMANYIDTAKTSEYSNLPQAEEKEYYEASSMQQRIYFLQQFDLGSTAYNMPNGLVIEGALNLPKFKSSFERLVSRHEVLKTSFHMIDGGIFQKIHTDVRFELELEQDSEMNIEHEIALFVKPFELNSAPLVRAKLIRLEKDKHLFLFDMHHIISDVSSISLLFQEMAMLYGDYDLSPVSLQYKDYSEWEKELRRSNTYSEKEIYWLNQFADEIPLLDLPTDFMRPSVRSFEGDSIRFVLQPDIVQKLNNIGSNMGCTMFILLLSSINILLSKYSGQEDIIIGCPVAGRTHPDMSNIIGMFVNTIALRNRPKRTQTFLELLEEVKENLLKSFHNQDYSFEELVDKLNLNRDLARNPLFDVMFTMQNVEFKDICINELTFKNINVTNNISKFDLSFSYLFSK